MPDISVIIPIYNRADLILETLSSVEDQTCTPSEVIIVDDGSTDNSIQIVSSWQKNTKLNAKIYKNQNKKGQSGALNYGISKANGGYIAMQDSDDLWAPCHLQQLSDALAKNPHHDVAFSKVQVFGPAKDSLGKNIEFTNSVRRCLEFSFEKKSDLIWLSQNKLLYTILQWGFPFRCQASLIRKSFFVNNNVWFDEEITYCLDAQFVTIAAFHTSFIYIDNVGLYLRRHSENDGDLIYGDKIWRSYEVRVAKLKKYFENKSLTEIEKSALKYRLAELQTQVLIAKTKKFGFLSFLNESVILFNTSPSSHTIFLILKMFFKYLLRVLYK